MSQRDPDWLPTPAPGTGPDAPMDDGDCEYCDGTGDDPHILEARGIVVDCEHCGGTGAWQGDEEPDPDSMPGGVDDL